MTQVNSGIPSAASNGLCSCHVCRLVSRRSRFSRREHCPRCGATLHFRKPRSIERCWALVIASYILYIPANLLVMMETGSLINYRKDTIVSGVVHLWKTGSWMIAVIVFIASVAIPVLKLFSLTFLLISVQRRSTWRPRQRTRLFRLLEAVGRWSMLDIYVVTLLAALVQLGSLAVVKAGPAAVAFGAVVILTMFATMQFDPRLIWDPLQKEEIHD
ncbi:Paraquat-inducible protein A [Citrifermentans bremense]|uniref:Paraquat-inducible protein A n=1 Tax=Citrifermentans bremense TaxID=60035 RepID=A0A6S6LYB9_9BACT|nr:paraquat-inducible protein A [Citrifermentans bremense]BCG47067.1 Paraquat-inducible protein A [Citrifermentans bremense]